ncbi:MAG: glutaminyl-peptide cyclotransferase [Desulfobacterales bacterium]|nr:glutaminyl-peptide cyclotransferase [Desulfobacterales bacterium]
MSGEHGADDDPKERGRPALLLFFLSSWIILFFGWPVAPGGAAENLPTRGVALLSSLQGVPYYTCRLVAALPHDPGAFTQGLAFHQGVFYESTGLWGSSSLRRVEVETGKILKIIQAPRQYFAEGVAILKDRVYQLTWRSRKCFIYDLESFRKIGEVGYTGEGWGATHDGELLIMSDGTDRLKFIEPRTFRVKRILGVHHRGRPLKMLNELEYIQGEIFANVFGADVIVRLDPRSGEILGVIDISALWSHLDKTRRIDVANGIAWDGDAERLWVTGKLWPKIFEIRLTPAGRTPIQ